MSRFFRFQLCGFVLMFAALFQSGCRAPGGKGLVNPHLAKVTFSQRHLYLQDVQVHENPGGLLVVDVSWYNRLPSGTAFQYQVFWKDERGGVLSSADQGWRGTTMSKGRFPMRLVAKNNRAVDFRLTIERRK